MKYLDKFFEHLRFIHYAERTIESYYYNLKKLDNFLRGVKITDEKEVTDKHIDDYIKHIRSLALSQRSYCRVLYDIKTYFTFLESQKIIFFSPVSHIDIPKEEKNPIKPIDKDVLRELLDSINEETSTAIRIRTILELGYSSALRPREIISIKIGDIDFSKKILFIRCSKNKKDRVVPVTENALFWVKKYIDEVRVKFVTNTANNYLFIPHYPNCKTEHIDYRCMFYCIRRYFQKHELKRFKLYALRSSSATHLLLNGMDISHIKMYLGHERLSTTQGYLRIETLDLKNILDSKHPRNKFDEKQGGKK